MNGGGIVVVGASWGGLHALTLLVSGLPAGFPLPVVLVQHRSRDSSSALADIIQESSIIPVCEVDDKAPVMSGHVHIAPPDYHLLIEGDHFSLSTEAPQRYSRPSIDVTFESAGLAFDGSTIGVVLTGANEDGARGLLTIVRRGGRAIIQDPTTAESPTMPRAAMRQVPMAAVVPLDRIAPRLVELVAERAAAAPARPERPARSGTPPRRESRP